MSTRVLANGCAFKEDTTASSSYTTVPGVYEIKLPDEYDYNEIEATALDDTFENNIIGIQKGRMVEVKMYWDGANATQIKLRTKAALGTTSIYKIVTSDATPITYTFTGYIQFLGDTTSTPKDAFSKTCKIRLTTAITIA